jgi:hypothetical protein
VHAAYSDCPMMLLSRYTAFGAASSNQHADTL